MLHDEMNHIASFAATKAFANSFGGRNAERGRFIVVKRAETEIIDPSFA
jgi:hypothetical protein